MKKVLAALTATAALAAAPTPAGAETLTAGILTETTSLSPLYFNANYNNQVFTHIYSHLIARGHHHEQHPGLAVSWKPIDDKVWEFKLRKEAKWHDGSPFTADDVLATVEEAKKVIGSGSPGGRYFFGKEYKKIDDHTFHVTTGAPYPTMPYDLAVGAIISKKHGGGKGTEDYNSGKAAVGTGPYKLAEWVKGDRLVMEAWKDYWGGAPGDFIPKPSWDRIVLKPMVSDAARVAAMLNGDVDMIDFVPTPDIARMRKAPNVTVIEAPSDRVIYLQLDSGRDISPDVFTNDGQPLFPNPLRDWRVRKAISKAINRAAIVERVMEGSAVPAEQMAPKFLFGSSPNLQPEPFDLEGAKKLMETAGYGDGFKITIRGPNDRYINDAKIIETIAGMLRRINIKADVAPEPKATYFGRSRGYSFMLQGFGTDTGESSSILTSVLHRYSPAENLGFINFGWYQNPRVDQAIEAALITMDDKKRAGLLAQASEIAVADVGHIPLHYQMNVWALKKGLTHPARTDERTLPLFVTKEKK